MRGLQWRQYQRNLLLSRRPPRLRNLLMWWRPPPLQLAIIQHIEHQIQGVILLGFTIQGRR